MYDGRRIRLRAMEPADIPAQHRWWNDRDVTRFLAPRYPYSTSVITERNAERGLVSYPAARFSVDRLDTGALIGFAALRDAGPEDRDAEVDLLIGERDAWGSGFGTDIMQTLCRFGFDEMNLHRIHLYVFPDNLAAIRVYEKIGFVHEGRIREVFWKLGQWHDLLLMSLLPGELRA